MQLPFDVLILRDPRESLRRCSLTPLRGMEGVRFVSYHPDLALDCRDRLLLHPEGELLTEEDAGRDLLLVDCAWRRLPSLLRTVRGDPPRRRLPGLVSAYPRRSRTYSDPETGLASIEALYAAIAIVWKAEPELLRSYRWTQEFLALNREQVPQLAPS